MTPLVLIALIAGIPVLLAILFRVNSLYLFLSVTIGYLLTEFIGETTALTVRTLIKNGQPELITNFTLFGLPILLSLLFLRKTLSPKQFPVQLIPLLGNGLLILVLSIPLMTAGTRGTIMINPLGHAIYQSTDIVVTLVAVIHLLLLWATGKLDHKGRRK
jgi:hypothetical protein